VEAGASHPAEVARAQVAADLVRAERERSTTALAIARLELATLMGISTPNFSRVVGDLDRVGNPPGFRKVLAAIESNPQLIRFETLEGRPYDRCDRLLLDTPALAGDDRRHWGGGARRVEFYAAAD
jgi:hypothetical protein